MEELLQYIYIYIFKHGNLVLLYDSQFQNYHGKLKMKWLGPFWVLEVFTNNSM
jgi:hypothetical protein